jgi:hypothetical protein
MSEYPIVRWDAVRFQSSPNAYPMLYVKPDNRLKHLENNTVFCTVRDSNTPFDQYKVAGIVYKSSCMPNPRPNFYAKTGNYVIVLLSQWTGYPSPDHLGVVTIDTIVSSPQKKAPTPVRYAKKKCSTGMCSSGADRKGLLIVFFIISLLFLVSICCSLSSSN